MCHDVASYSAWILSDSQYWSGFMLGGIWASYSAMITKRHAVLTATRFTCGGLRASYSAWLWNHSRWWPGLDSRLAGSERHNRPDFRVTRFMLGGIWDSRSRLISESLTVEFLAGAPTHIWRDMSFRSQLLTTAVPVKCLTREPTHAWSKKVENTKGDFVFWAGKMRTRVFHAQRRFSEEVRSKS